jgi:folate-binding protein YgfZ
MSDLKQINLTDRGVIAISGPETRSFLQGIVTNDVEKVDSTRALYSALLTPQGKFLFDFFMVDDGDGGLLLDVKKERLAELAKRLKFYKLRAKAQITDVSDRFTVTALIGDGAGAASRLHEGAGNARRDGDTVLAIDPRLADMGVRAIHPVDTTSFAEVAAGSLTDYEIHRMALAVPDGGTDVLVDKSFILESNFEELNAVDFEKGCYVGQELTARTKFRGTIRRRLFGITADAELPPAGTPITVGKAEIGEVRSGLGDHGIALIRIDRLEEAGGDAADVMAGDVAIKPVKPSWVSF